MINISDLSSQSQPVPPPAQTISSLPGATAIFGQAWAIYKQRFGTFLGVMIIPMLVIMAIFLAIFIGGGPLGASLLSSKSAAGGIGLFIFLAILFFVIILISQTWAQAALLYAIKDSQERIGVIESYRRGWHKILSYWWISLLGGFIVSGGLFLLVIPGIIFAVWFSLALFILVAEDLKGMNALLKSKEYVKGKWGGVFWRFLFIGVLSIIISLLPPLIFSLLKIPLGSGISRFVIGLFLPPFIITYLFLIYSNLKALKGETIFTPTGGKKAIFILTGILGILIIPTILFLAAFLGLGVTKVGSVKGKTRDTERRLDLIQIQIGLKAYYDDYNNYPFSLDELSPKYLPSIPVDPSTNQPYQYQLQPNGTDYKVCARMDSTKAQKCITSQF